MANKKKIEERLQELQTQKTQRRIRLLGGGVIVIALALLGYMLLNSDHSPNFKPVTSALPAATEASSEEENTVKRYSAYPPMTIDRAKKYFAVVKMEKGGEFTIQLFPDKAPLAVNSFVFLARDGYFDGVTFHRVLDGFMAQGGDPTGTGMGDPGYAFDNEDSDLKFDKAGVVAMANAGRNTNGSQFFITFAPAEFLNGGYTIFGQVVEGMDVVNGITRRDPELSPSFAGDVIETITITEE
ncbi:MAG: hypothetical protein HKUEN02_15260 [Anaerolineaceae bacterium]|nr:MAG: hypothetical protein HKUEN02_15260 [Anaerolineaceae bacterium]